MGHATESELRSILDEAASQVEVSARYRHYKGNTYIVIALALDEADESASVLYQAEYGQRIMFVRPLSSWLETIEVNAQAVPRFVKIVN